MKKIEVEGGEFMIQSKEGHYAIIPAKDRKKVMKLLKDGCDDCINSYINTLPRDSDYAEKGTIVSKLYEEKTGKPWKTAKEEGLTTGSYNDNIKLREKLLSGEFDNKNKQLITSNQKNELIENQDYTKATSFNEAFKIARNQLGANQIFEYQGKKYGTNIAGEEFKPSKETLKLHGMNQDAVKKRIDLENSLVASPYSSKDKAEIEPEFIPWEDVKQRNIELNKLDQASLIVNFNNNSGSDKPYAIIDKKKGLLHIYKPGSDFPIYSSPVDLGETISDAQTVTKVNDPNNDGIITKEEAAIAKADFAKGNKSTGAGKFYISNISLTGYQGKPLFNLMNESQYNEYLATGKVGNVATSIHTGYIPDDNARVSNGCIRCNKPTLDALNKYMSNLSEVYILPEEEGNAFVYENGKLNFKANARSNYESYIDSRGEQQRGQGINRTKNTLNYIPIKLELNEELFREKVFQWNDFNDERELRETTMPYIQALANNKQRIMKVAGINGDVYNDIAKIAFGIYGTESNFGDTHSAVGNFARAVNKAMNMSSSSSPDYKSKATTYGANEDFRSVGLTQIRFNMLDANEKKILAELGITDNMQLLDPTNAAIATTAILAMRYNNQLTSEQKKDIETYLPKTWNNRKNYSDRVKSNSRYLTVKQLN